MPIFDKTRKQLREKTKSLLTGPFADATDSLFRREKQYVAITHVPTGKTVYFKAWITKFVDMFKSDWKQHGGYGRMDPVLMFQGTARSLQIGFKVLAADIFEAKDNMNKMSVLQNMLYPTFDNSSGGNTPKSSPFVKIKFMNWSQNSVDGSGLLGAFKRNQF